MGCNKVRLMGHDDRDREKGKGGGEDSKRCKKRRRDRVVIGREGWD